MSHSTQYRSFRRRAVLKYWRHRRQNKMRPFNVTHSLSVKIWRCSHIKGNSWFTRAILAGCPSWCHPQLIQYRCHLWLIQVQPTTHTGATYDSYKCHPQLIQYRCHLWLTQVPPITHTGLQVPPMTHTSATHNSYSTGATYDSHKCHL